jgi:hypothetical protein
LTARRLVVRGPTDTAEGYSASHIEDPSSVVRLCPLRATVASRFPARDPACASGVPVSGSTGQAGGASPVEVKDRPRAPQRPIAVTHARQAAILACMPVALPKGDLTFARGPDARRPPRPATGGSNRPKPELVWVRTDPLSVRDSNIRGPACRSGATGRGHPTFLVSTRESMDRLRIQRSRVAMVPFPGIRQAANSSTGKQVVRRRADLLYICEIRVSGRGLGQTSRSAHADVLSHHESRETGSHLPPFSASVRIRWEPTLERRAKTPDGIRKSAAQGVGHLKGT